MTTPFDRAILAVTDGVRHEAPGFSREAAADVVRRVLTAIREPSEPMVDVAQEMAHSITIDGSHRWRDYIADVHRAMIDALMVEGRP